MSANAEVLVPTSPEDAVSAFGDGTGVTVIAGGTIVTPDLTYGRLKPERVLLLARAELDRITHENNKVTIGAATPVSILARDAAEPLATAAAHVADLEIRAQATLGGNLCAGPAKETPRGDLQAPLIVLGASVRSTGAGGERVESVEEFLAGGTEGRLVLDISHDDGKRRAGYSALWRPHAHHYTVLAACCTAAGNNTALEDVRVAVTGAAPTGRRCPSVEQAIEGKASSDADIESAAREALADVECASDALATAWYRERMLPKVIAQALSNLAVSDGAGNR